MSGNTKTKPPTTLEIYRRVRGLTRQELADLACVHRETVARIERRQTLPNRTTAMALAAVLRIDLAALFPEEAAD